MSLPFDLRPMAPEERSLVLSDWKKDLEHRRRDGYGPHQSLLKRDFWCLANFVVDKITFPSAEIIMGCYETTPETPLFWIALRSPDVNSPTYPTSELPMREVLHIRACKSIGDDAALAASLERELLSRLSVKYRIERRHYNLFTELRR
jgi:hypothetical protein